MVGIERDLWGSSSPTSLISQGDLKQAAQDRVQAGFEDLQRRRLHNPSRHPVPVLHHPQSKAVLPQVKRPHARKALQFCCCFWPTSAEDAALLTLKIRPCKRFPHSFA